MRYWFPLLPLATLLLYGLHLATGKTPPPIWFGAEGLPIYGAAVLLVTAVILAYLVVAILTADHQGSHTYLLAMLASILFWGLIGARLYHVFCPCPLQPYLHFADYLANPWLILSLRSGGLGFYGGGVARGWIGTRHILLAAQIALRWLGGDGTGRPCSGKPSAVGGTSLTKSFLRNTHKICRGWFTSAPTTACRD